MLPLLTADGVEGHIAGGRHPSAATGVAGNGKREREQAIGTNDVTSRREDGAIDEAEHREVGADRHREHDDCGQLGYRRCHEGSNGAE